MASLGTPSSGAGTVGVCVCAGCLRGSAGSRQEDGREQRQAAAKKERRSSGSGWGSRRICAWGSSSSQPVKVLITQTASARQGFLPSRTSVLPPGRPSIHT